MEATNSSGKVEAFEVRKLEISDKKKGFVELLEQLTVCDSISDEAFDERFGEVAKYGNDHLICVIEDKDSGKIIATGSVFIEKKFIRNCGKVGHIEDVVVDSSVRGKHLGKKIIEFLSDHARSMGCYKVILDCSSENMLFYERCGFKQKEIQMVKLAAAGGHLEDFLLRLAGCGGRLIGETNYNLVITIHAISSQKFIVKEMDRPKHTCLKLEIATGGSEPEPVFVKGTWYPTRFDLSISDGLQAWTCHATDEEVKERASYWDQTASDYIDLAERYLGFQQPGSVYGFSDAGEGCKRLSWTFEKEGMKLEWRWKCHPSPNSKKTTVDVLDFLMDANIKLSEEVVWKSQSFDKLKMEAEKCLTQSEKLNSEKSEFESEIYAKFVQVLNSKKAKLRDLRDRLSKQPTADKFPDDEEEEEEQVSTDRTESLDEASDEDVGKNGVGVSSSSKPRGRKRK
ncbi:DNA ligase IV-binding protein [Perilla frutescens var. hirtella]|uniref:glucosamine-phosphate N-acetyltransferase n=1 Tax=Perilla frutescens var. hirtella TaxID=608512 RepID=A0AAD4NZR0_PERFH|nr:DNA ligase IV-binding protein [Perilla frutescens var. hirtella]